LDGQHQSMDKSLNYDSLRKAEDRDEWRSFVRRAANPRSEDC
jgi:hypothetical protein